MDHSSYCKQLFGKLLMVAPFNFSVGRQEVYIALTDLYASCVEKRIFRSSSFYQPVFYAAFAKQCSGVLLTALFCIPALIHFHFIL